MRAIHRIAVLPLIAAATAASLTACQDEAPPASPTSAAATSAAAESSTSESSAPAETAAPTESGSSSTSASDESASAVPESEREDAKSKSSIPAERSKIPAGPMTSVEVKTLGGYDASGDGEHGTFYAVLDVDSTEPGLVDLEYVLLDKSGKEIGAIKDGLNVGGTKDELKVTRASGELPPASEGKVEKVQLRVTKNTANQFATVTTIDPKFEFATDPDGNFPIVKGRYKTEGKASVTNLTAICTDAQGIVHAASSPVEKIESPTWTPFEVKLILAPDGFKPAKCYVGS
ncbi:hypothetical protein [Demetria terragena]|uniref:hypothetical protein n=1 Tax=Demetria terragena TaxID=63959 RepID=UPI00035D65C2|nr:hypothetical protein [Demetria terragena]